MVKRINDPAIFLDRDGVINRKAPEGRYISTWEEVEFLPGALDAVATLYAAGFAIVIVTNQRGVARRIVKPESLREMHERMRTILNARGVCVTDVYVCPHDIADQCECRKPKPGMLLAAAREHGIDLARSWMIGDKPSDVAAGKAAGCRTILITSNGARNHDVAPDLIAPDLTSAARQILHPAKSPITC